MNLSDAKFILTNLLDKKLTDSIIDVYKTRDKVNESTISLQVSKIKLLQEKSDNQEILAQNLNTIITNKDTEISLLKDTIKQQKREIRKQKFLKVLGFSAAIILPIVVLIFGR